GARQHPEAAIGMDPADPLRPEHTNRPLDAAGNLVGGLDLVVLDVDDADAQRDAGLQIAKDLQFSLATAGELQHEMVASQRVEKRQEVPKEAFLDRLSTIIAE